MFEWVFDYLYFYQKFLRASWNNLGPTEYITILFTVGAVGWYLMRKGPSNKC
ncbi:MAG: hypothetical protein AABP62_19875 [Planctomycetota bacterium]